MDQGVSLCTTCPLPPLPPELACPLATKFCIVPGGWTCPCLLIPSQIYLQKQNISFPSTWSVLPQCPIQFTTWGGCLNCLPHNIRQVGRGGRINGSPARLVLTSCPSSLCNSVCVTPLLLLDSYAPFPRPCSYAFYTHHHTHTPHENRETPPVICPGDVPSGQVHFTFVWRGRHACTAPAWWWVWGLPPTFPFPFLFLPSSQSVSMIG